MRAIFAGLGRKGLSEAVGGTELRDERGGGGSSQGKIWARLSQAEGRASSGALRWRGARVRDGREGRSRG